MKASRKTLFALVGAMAVGAAVAAPSVEITSVQQQYPWTNTVDIVYTVAGVVGDEGYFVKFTPTTSAGVGIPDVNGQYDIQVALTNSGTYTAQWFPQTNQQYTACKMVPSVWRGSANDYMIVDLLTGEVTYEPMATQEASNERYQAAEYKLSKMVFRKIAAGTPVYLSKTNTSYTVTADYYMGIYEVTVGQYACITSPGTTVANTDANKKPKVNVTWNVARGSALPTARVSGGPAATLNSQVASAMGNGKFYADLPTDQMWEVACRGDAGRTTTYYWGEDKTNAKLYANYSGSGYGSTCLVVGSLRPNDIGIYDMSGNAWEWTRDAATSGANGLCRTPMTAAYLFAPYASGTYRSQRGGAYGDANYYTSYAFPRTATATGVGDMGFRLAVYPQ